jgi:predicted porin
MKKSLIALTVLGAVAGVAQAQSAVTVYGVLDVSIQKKTGTTTAIGRGDNNRLGFKGTEDLGGGLSAIFQLETRFEPDTGTVEGGSRPLFQGQSRVGLAGGFGSIKLGRGLTALQERYADYDPFLNRSSGAADMSGFQTSGYKSEVRTDGLSTSGSRFNNGLHYTTPSISGFQAAVTVQTKEAVNTTAGAPELPSNPYSVAAGYNNGPIAALLAFERNNVEDKLALVAGAYDFGVAKALLTYSKKSAVAANSDVKSWVLGADAPVGPGSIKVAYGQSKLDATNSTDKKFALGYWHNLSKRTYLYTDAARTKIGTTGISTNAFDLGIRHTF